jgi:microcystin-dependent protein
VGTPFLGEVKIISWNYAPKGWAFCNGQFLPINQNQALFSLFGTMYGGNGQTNFALPDLRGRAPVHIGGQFNVQGQTGGEQAHTLSQSEMTQHIHFGQASSVAATAVIPNNTLVLASQGQFEIYRAPTSLGAMKAGTIGNTGGSQPHNNMQPYLVVNYIVALIGVFPSRN